MRPAPLTDHPPKRKIFPVKVKCCKRTSLISDRGDHFLDGDFTILLFLSSCKRPLDACSVYKQLLVTTHGTAPCINCTRKLECVCNTFSSRQRDLFPKENTLQFDLHKRPLNVSISDFPLLEVSLREFT